MLDHEIIVFIMQQIEVLFSQSFIGTFVTSLMNKTVINWIYFLIDILFIWYFKSSDCWLQLCGTKHLAG